jgi:hypothetical protein
LFEEMRRIDLLWEIVKYTANLLWIFNVYKFCCFNFFPKNMNCFPFQRSSINYRLIWEKILKCKGEQIDLKTELKLPNNLFYLY